MSGATCSSCGAPIVWGTTKAGKKVPLDPPEDRYARQPNTSVLGEPLVVIRETWLSHFATCPNADQHRRGR